MSRSSAVLLVPTVALAAYLLFTLELLAGRLLLPVFGGSASVWTTALVLFTGLLFMGYLYAHILVRRLSRARGDSLHLIVTGFVIAAAIAAPRDVSSLRIEGIPIAANVLVASLVLVGAQIFVLASTTPLLSARFAGRGGDSWWFYAVSNGASLAALIAYPFLIEPALALSAQRSLSVMAMAVFAVLFAAGAAWDHRSHRADSALPRAIVGDARRSAGAPAWRRQLGWLAAAFVPAGLLAASNSLIATDLASGPLLWIGPLGIYLLSLVVAFSRYGRRSLPVIEVLVPAAVTLMWFPFLLGSRLAAIPLVLLVLGSYAVIAIAIHGRLAQDRPDQHHLTRYYLVIAGGGLLATAFVALVAPLVFSTVYEYPILIVAAIAVLAVLPGPRAFGRPSGDAPLRTWLPAAVRSLLPFVAVGALLFLFVVDSRGEGALLALMFGAGVTIILLGRSPAVLATGTFIALFAFTLVLDDPFVTRVRTFFGVSEIRVQDDVRFTLFSGTTVHGLQFRDGRSREPTSYYVRAGPVGEVFATLRERQETADIGVVGLGTGTLAAYTAPGDSLTFFEVDRAVIDLATAGDFFTYLQDAPVDARIIVGDARLSLLDELDESLDLIVLDAFSSDALPTHLLTREALESYAAKLRSDGIAMIHVSNRHYALADAVTATARAAGLEAVHRRYEPADPADDDLAPAGSEWILAGAADALEPFESLGWERLAGGSVLTDDFIDTLRLLR